MQRFLSFVFLLLVAVFSGASSNKDAVLLKTFDDVKNALLAGQHLTAWADFGGCKLLAEDGALPSGKDGLGLVSWTQKYTIWEWMAKIDNQEVFVFPSHQLLGDSIMDPLLAFLRGYFNGGGDFAAENVILWQNGTMILEIAMWTAGEDRNVTQIALNCTLGTSAAFRGWSDLKKPIDTATNAIAASRQEGAELSVVILYDNCTRIKPDEETGNGDKIQAISGRAMADAVISKDNKGDLFYAGSASYLQSTPDGNFRAFGDDVAILTNGTVYVDTFLDFFLGSKVVHRDYYAECEFGKSLLVFA